MQSKTCRLCGSKFTYAKSSRNKVKVGEDDKVVRDEDGKEVMLECRHCRNCGKDYYEDTKPNLEKLPKEMQELIKHTKAYMENRNKDASQEVAENVQTVPNEGKDE
jgi:hypothetical protein